MIQYNRNGLVIRTSVPGDASYMMEHLRQSDVDECMASHGHSPQVALPYCISRSMYCDTVLFNGKIVAMFGLCPDKISNKAATVWMLTTDDLDFMCYRFLKTSRIVIKEMLKKVELLYNFVDDRNAKAVRWLEWCGAVVDGPKPYGVNYMPFRFFFFSRRPSHV